MLFGFTLKIFGKHFFSPTQDSVQTMNGATCGVRLASAFQVLAVVLAFSIGTAAPATEAAAAEPPRRSPAYPALRSKVATELQIKLFENGCYGNQLTRNTELDQGNFGPKSRRALWVFIDTVNSNLVGSAKFRGSSLRPDAILTAFGIGRIASTPQYCRTFGAQFLDKYFTDKNEHIPGGGANVCRKDSIGREYLAGLTSVPGASTLSDSLRAVIRNFDGTVFPPGAGDPVVLSDSNKGRIKRFGIKGVTPDTTRSALVEAAYNFDNLVLAYALQKTKCGQCAAINDWLYLRNIASANAGYLIAKKHDADIFYRFDVNKIPEDMMEQVRPNIRVYRSITAKLNEVLTGNLDPALTRTLITQRDAELAGITKFFQDTYQPATASKSMSEIARGGTCVGFDGSAIYQ